MESNTLRGLSLTTSIIVSAVMAHLLIVFYAKEFEPDDLLPIRMFQKSRNYYTENHPNLYKAVLCAILIVCCAEGWIIPKYGRLLVVVLALPQLFRLPGRKHQQLRVVVGPLTPILVLSNVVKEPLNWAHAGMGLASFAAFVLLRPDNTVALDLFLEVTSRHPSVVSLLGQAKQRRVLHGFLATCNASIAFMSMITWFRPAFQKFLLDVGFNSEIYAPDQYSPY